MSCATLGFSAMIRDFERRFGLILPDDERAFLRLPPDYPGTVVQCSAELG